jgi:hypothetical protein
MLLIKVYLCVNGVINELFFEEQKLVKKGLKLKSFLGGRGMVEKCKKVLKV